MVGARVCMATSAEAGRVRHPLRASTCVSTSAGVDDRLPAGPQNHTKPSGNYGNREDMMSCSISIINSSATNQQT